MKQGRKGRGGIKFALPPRSEFSLKKTRLLARNKVILDNQTFWRESGEFERFCEETEPVPLSLRIFESRQEFPVWIRNQDGKWVKGTSRQFSDRNLYVKAGQQIKGGASGGPVVDSFGQLLGVTSWFSEVHDDRLCDGSIPLLHRTLPVWLRERILLLEDQEGGE